eukprot:TCONS_00031321-protein
MDKPKLAPGPKPRVKRTALPPPGDFIALGSKNPSGKPRPNESDLTKPLPPGIRKPNLGSVSHVTTGSKRKDLSPVNPVAAKQSRTFSPSFNRKEKSLDVHQILPTVKLIDAPAIELEETVLAAVKKEDQDQIDGLICNAIKLLKNNRLKPEPMLYLTLMNLAKSNPAIFSSKKIVEHLLQFLKRENTLGTVKPKPNTLLSIMTCNILLHAFQKEDIWPQSFMKVYVDDALADRSWVDNENNKDFVQNITTVFGTTIPKKPNVSKGNQDGSATVVPMETGTGGEKKCVEEKIMEDLGISIECDEPALIRNRYMTQKDESAIQNHILEVVKEQLNKRQMIDSVSRNTLRFLTSVCGYVEVRLHASQRMETWLQNPKLTRPAQELLMSVVLNCNTHSEYDVDVISNLVKMRLKSKPNHYINCMKELLSKHPDNLSTTMRRVIYNELSQQRNPNNMAILSVMFSYAPQQSAQHLSCVFQELLCNREDYLRAIRALFREIVRSLKYDINMVEFCRGLMQERRETSFLELEQIYKDRILVSIIDLITMACFLCVSPTVKELASAVTKDEKRDYTALKNFQQQIALIQQDTVWFFHTKVKFLYNCNDKEFVLGLFRALFLDPAETYNQRDNWPPESEKNLLMQLVTEVPLMEDTLLRLHMLGLSPEIALPCDRAMEIIEKLVFRSAVLSSIGRPGLAVERLDAVKMLLSLAAYTYPKEITLPPGYESPNLAITLLYWRAWSILLVIAALNPTTIGIYVWENYPTARCMMEMLITGCYDFPPFASSGMTLDDARNKELQMARSEKDEIIVFEGHLAAATSGQVITESTSRLISQLISLDPTGPARQPPANYMKQLKSLNEKHQLGKLLCQCRSPDFLLSIIESQGSSKSMPWLADLVQSSESSLNALPLQCLCEFLLMGHNSMDKQTNKQKSIKSKVAGRLQDLLFGNEATEDSVSSLVQYFVNRWSSPSLKDRDASVFAFKTIILHHKKTKTQSVSSESEMETEIPINDPFHWMHQKLLTFPFFGSVLPDIINAMTKALRVEMDPCRIRAYINFLSQHQTPSTLPSIVDSLSNLITGRIAVIDRVLSEATPKALEAYKCLLQITATYVQTQQQLDDKSGPDLIQWMDGPYAGKSAILPLPLLRACVQLLTYKSLLSGGMDTSFDFLHRVFVPFNRMNIHHDILFDASLKKKLLRCGEAQFAREVLVASTVVETLSFIQMPAIPKAIQLVILERLDDFSNTQPKMIELSTPNKERLIRLVECLRPPHENIGNSFLGLLKNSITLPETDQTHNASVVIPRISVISSAPKQQRSVTRSLVQFDENEISTTLLEAFTGTSKISKPYLTLKQQLSKENITKQNGTLAIKVLHSIDEFCKQQSFKTHFCNNRESCILVRILSSSNVKNSDTFVRFLECLSRDAPQNKSMENLLNNLFKNLSIENKEKAADKTPRQCMEELMDQSVIKIPSLKQFLDTLKGACYQDLNKDQLAKVGIHIFNSQRSMFQDFLKVLCQHSKSQRDDGLCVEVMIQIMRNSSNGIVSGIIVDWLCRVDPEILQLNPMLLREFLFTRNEKQIDGPIKTEDLSKQPIKTESSSKEPIKIDGSSSEPINDEKEQPISEENKCVAYLTSVMAHEIRGCTLQDCIQWMFSSTKSLERFNATSCLDFTTTLLNNPRLWQGRDNKHQHQQQADHDKPCDENNQHNEEESPLTLTMSQTHQLMHIILMELSSAMSNPSSDQITTLMEKRLSLLLNVAKNKTHLQKAVNLVKTTKKFPEDVLACFLQYLYMKKPTLSNLSNELFKGHYDNPLVLPMENKMEMDLIIHRLILTISEPDDSPEFKETFQSVSTLHRRIASQHPFAFVRQLPLLLSLLKGKNRLTANNFKWTNQLTLCNHVFEMFHLLREHVFSSQKICENLITDFVDVFLDLIYAPCLQNNDVAAFVEKLSNFMMYYASFNGKEAGLLLKKHDATFKELQYDFPNFIELTNLVSFMKSFDENAHAHFTLVKSTMEIWSESKLKSYRKRLSTDHHKQDLEAVLMELKKASKIHAELLHHFIEELSLLVFSDDERIRELSHELIINSYQKKPSDANNLIDLYTKCVNSNKLDILLSAAKFAPQGLLLCSDRVDSLLLHLYKKAVTSHPELDVPLRDLVTNLSCDYQS